MSKNFKKRLYEILEVSKPNDKISKYFDIFIVLLILINVIFVIMETVEGIASEYKTFFYIVEVFSVTIFTIEYILRLYACTENKKYKRPVMGRIRYAFSFYMIIDLLAIMPFYLPYMFKADLRILRTFRLLRILRLIKIGRYSKSLKYLIDTFKSKKDEIYISAFIVFIILIISSTMIYYVEKDVQPDAFSSIPDAMWWGVAALSTTGYGDVYPITPLGRFLGALITIAGIGIFAVPAGIIASGFINKMQGSEDDKKKKVRCPHCGKDIKLD